MARDYRYNAKTLLIILELITFELLTTALCQNLANS